MLPADKAVSSSGRGQAPSSCGNEELQLNVKPGVVLTSEGSVGASPAMNYLGPGWRDV